MSFVIVARGPTQGLSEAGPVAQCPLTAAAKVHICYFVSSTKSHGCSPRAPVSTHPRIFPRPQPGQPHCLRGTCWGPPAILVPSSDPEMPGLAQNLYFNRFPRQLKQPPALSQLGRWQPRLLPVTASWPRLQEKGQAGADVTDVCPEPFRAWDTSCQDRPSMALDTLGKLCSSECKLSPPHPHFLIP